MALIATTLFGYQLFIFLFFAGGGPWWIWLWLIAGWAVVSGSLAIAWWNIKRGPRAISSGTGVSEFLEEADRNELDADRTKFDAYDRAEDLTSPD
ncbi:MAG: hypothetical protein RIE08_10805 [Acidimicrobiales bacterium]